MKNNNAKRAAKKSALALSLGFALTLPMGACVNEIEPGNGFDTSDFADQKALPWASNDDPNTFSSSLVYTMADLPTEGGAATSPWAGSYWPTHEDSINKKWDGSESLSPAAKYGEAFNVSGVEAAVSGARGVTSQSHRTACTDDEACNKDIGESCSKREGEEDGYCIPTWFGICHAWAPAAILVPEPKHPVVRNGVEFKVQDIKALVTLAHDQVTTRFVSGRCNDDEAQGNIKYDEYGRPEAGQCIDTNPATMHILVSNYLGLQSQSFVIDRTFDDEVWNQPLRRYRIPTVREIDGVEANRLVGVTRVGGTETELAAAVEKDAWKHFDAIAVQADQNLNVTMTGSGDGDLYVRFSEQPDAESYHCRPYQGGSDESCELTVPAGVEQAFVSVQGYTEATVAIMVRNGGEVPTSYIFNDDAVRFYEVHMELDYIGESPTGLDGNLADTIDRYTFTDRYTYVLEADADDRLIGGEWTGSSKRGHPDFLWLPTGVGRSSVASGKIKYDEVMSLVNESVGTTEEGEGEAQAYATTLSLAHDEMRQVAAFEVAAGAISVTLTGTGDGDIYVRKGTAPTQQLFECRPYISGSDESCELQGPGVFHVAVHGYTAAEVTLSAQYTGSAPVEAPKPEEESTCTVNADCASFGEAFECDDGGCVERPDICIQVTQPAESPDGECVNFATPCDVPAGWTNVTSCEDEPAAMPQIIVNEILADPAPGLDGDANCDGVRNGTDDEFIEFINVGEGSADLSGATLSDGYGVRHVFPEGTILDAGAVLVVFGGGEPTFPGAHAWCGARGANVTMQTASQGLLGLNNGGDTVSLVLSNGVALVSGTWGAEVGNNASVTLADETVATSGYVSHNSIASRVGPQSPGATAIGGAF